jgi:LPS sulfotransferase NodH
VITYEDDLGDAGPEQAVRKVLRHLDLPVPPGWQAPKSMRRQADERSDRWVERYRQRKPSLAA